MLSRIGTLSVVLVSQLTGPQFKEQRAAAAKEAEAMLAAAARLQPRDAAVQSQLGKLLSGLEGRGAEAVAHLDAAWQVEAPRMTPLASPYSLHAVY